MARAGAHIIDSGDHLPSISMQTVAHDRVLLPYWFEEQWGVLLVYRAHW
jgi:hypothetical protein